MCVTYLRSSDKWVQSKGVVMSVRGNQGIQTAVPVHSVYYNSHTEFSWI